MSIYKQIPAIMAEVGAIEKNRKGQGISYAFRGIDDIYSALQPLLAKHKVFYAPNVISQVREQRESKSGGVLTYSILTVEYTFFAEDGSNFKLVTVGEAMDSSDKSSNKAMSAALKYAMLQLFCIPTEEEKDTEYQNHGPSFPPQAVQAPVGNSEDPGSYVIKVGKKWAGMALEKIGAHDAASYGKYLRDQAAEKGKPLTGDWAEAADMIDAFCKSRETKESFAQQTGNPKGTA